MKPTLLRVLIVEDSEDDALLLLRQLRLGGFDPEFQRVDTPDAMNRELEKNVWDAVIADYNMPHFSIPEALNLLKAKNLDIPFIILSGAIGEETAVNAMKAGAHDYIMKDNLARLIPAIDRELREAGMRKERREAESEKEKMQAQLLQAQKMEAIGTLTGGIAHDFNNLMTAVLGCADLGLRAIKPFNPGYEELKQIQVAAQRAAELTRQLLLFSRKQQMEFVPINLNTTVQNLLKILHRLIGEDIRITTHLDSGLLSILGDRVSIEQAIMNLAVNARDAMPDGGKLTITTKNVDLGETLVKSMPESRAGKFVCLSILDTGVGIDEETLRHIFEPFFSTKGVGKGTGLGLSVVYGIIKQHQGWIGVHSKANQGTLFEMYLPPVFMRVDNRAKSLLPAVPLRGNAERILIVEDETNVMRFASKALGRNGYTVYTASSAEEALEVFKEEKGNFQMVFSDVVLPGKSGPKLVDELLNLNPDLRIVLSSGYIDHKSQRAAIQEKGFPFLAKPYTLSDLLKTVGEVLNRNYGSDSIVNCS